MPTFKEELTALIGNRVKISIGEWKECVSGYILSIHDDWVEIDFGDRPFWRVPIGKINFFRPDPSNF
jgi:hypothetical protein